MTLQIKTSEALDYERLDWLCSELRTASREFSGATEMADNLLNFCVEHHYGSRDVPELIINRVIKNRAIAAELAECLAEVGEAVKAFAELGDVTAEIQRLGEAELRLDQLRDLTLRHKNRIRHEAVQNDQTLEKIIDARIRLGTLLLSKKHAKDACNDQRFQVTSTLQISMIDSPTVYIFRDDEGRPLYVGQSIRVLKRLREHQNRDFYNQSSTVDIIKCADKDEMCALEASLIKSLDPPHNIALRQTNRYQASFLKEQLDQLKVKEEVLPTQQLWPKVTKTIMRQRIEALDWTDIRYLCGWDYDTKPQPQDFKSKLCALTYHFAVGDINKPFNDKPDEDVAYYRGRTDHFLLGLIEHWYLLEGVNYNELTATTQGDLFA
jgi:predicted GIY-YIG superfamily endonuclease